MHRWILVTLVLLVACSPQASPTTTEPIPPSSTTQAPVSPPPPDPCAQGDVAFESSGLVGTFGESAGDARRLGSVRWRDEGACERLLVEFLTVDGAPASTLGAASAVVIGEAAIVRLSLPPEVEASAVADALIDGPLISRVVVTRGDEGLFLDVHLRPEPGIEARAFAVGGPARVVIDARAGSGQGAALAAPVTNEDVVVLTPISGPALYPITVTGYARPDETLKILLMQEGETADEVLLPNPVRRDTWRAFRTTFPDGPSGPVDVFVGFVDEEGNARGGVIVPLDVP